MRLNKKKSISKLCYSKFKTVGILFLYICMTEAAACDFFLVLLAKDLTSKDYLNDQNPLIVVLQYFMSFFIPTNSFSF